MGRVDSDTDYISANPQIVICSLVGKITPPFRFEKGGVISILGGHLSEKKAG